MLVVGRWLVLVVFLKAVCVVFCLLCVVCCVLFVVWLLCVVCCILAILCCVLRCLVLACFVVICRLLFDVCCLIAIGWCVVRCVMSIARYVRFELCVVCCLCRRGVFVCCQFFAIVNCDVGVVRLSSLRVRSLLLFVR